MTFNLSRTPSAFKKDGSEGRILANQIYVGVIKDNADAQRMGRLRVWIPEFGGEPGNEANWVMVSYASPFAGVTNPAQMASPSDGGDEYLKMSGTQKSYGWWGVPPDVENQVLVCFASGDLARGYWFACIYQQYMNHMVPGIPLNISTDDTVNVETLPPVCEYNKKDPDVDIKDPRRPIYEPLHNGLVEQGLYTDPERGPGTTGARRMEDGSLAPVYGLLTPGGNTIHIDEDPDNEFIRLRTKSGVQIVVHETTGYIYMNSKLGNSWMEISDEGINMYSKYNISMRAEGSINIHADGNVSTNGGAVHTRGGNVTTKASGQHMTESGGNTVRKGGNILDNPSKPDGGPQYGSSGGSNTEGEAGGDAVDGAQASSQGFIAPVEGVAGSQYGMRTHPIYGDQRMHHGVDFRGVPVGTPVVASRNGTVVSAGRAGGYGNMIEIDHGNGITTRYAHLNNINVSVGQNVSAGQFIGGVGSTGNSTGPHLHYEVRQNGNSIDPNSVHDNAFVRGNVISRGIDPSFMPKVDRSVSVSGADVDLVLRHAKRVVQPSEGDLVVLRDRRVVTLLRHTGGSFIVENGGEELAVSATDVMALRRVPIAVDLWLNMIRHTDDSCPCCTPVGKQRGLDRAYSDGNTRADGMGGTVVNSRPDGMGGTFIRDEIETKKLNSTTPPEAVEQQDVRNGAATTTATISSVLPTHEPWYGHPIPTKPQRRGIDGSTGSGSSGGSGGSGGSSGGGNNRSLPGTSSMSATGDIPAEGRALLDTIAQTEGTANQQGGGYTTGFGYTPFTDLSQHPFPPRHFTLSNGDTTSAAGRYQFQNQTWNWVADTIGLSDFSPENQDRAAWWQAQRVYRANGGGDLLSALRGGSFDPGKLGSEWASFPNGTGLGGGAYSAAQVQSLYDRNLEAQKKAGTVPERGDPGQTPLQEAVPASPAPSGTPARAAPVSTSPSIRPVPGRPI